MVVQEENEVKPEIPELPSNSLTKKDEPKKVIKAKRVEQKKSFLGNNVRGVGSYILFEVLIPAAKSTITDMISNGIEMLLYGEPRGSRNSRNERGGRDKSSFVSYTSYYNRDRDHDRDRERTRKSKFHLEDIVLDSREDGEEVMQDMFDILDEYNAVTVSEFLELVGLPDEYTDQNYGWTNLRAAEVRRGRDGYFLDLPEPRVLQR